MPFGLSGVAYALGLASVSVLHETSHPAEESDAAKPRSVTQPPERGCVPLRPSSASLPPLLLPQIWLAPGFVGAIAVGSMQPGASTAGSGGILLQLWYCSCLGAVTVGEGKLLLKARAL